MEVFYFVRKPDHMVECSKNLPSDANIERIKEMHKIFKTEAEALDYQKVLGVYPLKVQQQLNRDFIRDGLMDVWGYGKNWWSSKKLSRRWMGGV